MKNALVVGLTFLFGCAASPSPQPAIAPVHTAAVPAAPPVPADVLRITLLGSGVGPPVNLMQYGPSTLIEAGGKRLLFDCGRGATLRLAQAGIPIRSVSMLFLTHLHSDHVVQIPDLFLSGWVGQPGRMTPLRVWGPEGTASMMANLERAFEFDIHMRRDVDEMLSPVGITVQSHDITEGIVLDEDGVRVTAFVVDHEPVKPALGYRVDYRGHSVVLSGDTRVSENLIKFARGVDVLVHEAIDPDFLRANAGDRAIAERVIAHHTTGEEAGRVFTRVAPRLAVYSHAPGRKELIEQTRRTYSGPLQGAEDLLRIDVGTEITVQRIEH
jgi:ribonuclease Z